MLNGPMGVGKSALLRLLRSGKYYGGYNRTCRTKVHPLAFYTNRGPVQFHMHDMVGPERTLSDGYDLNQTDLPQIHGAFLMFELTNEFTLEKVESNLYRQTTA